MALAAEKRPTCAVVVSRAPSTTDARLREAETIVIKSVYPFCRPKGQRKLSAVLDEPPSSTAGVRQARSDLSAARTHFLNVRFDQAEEKARQAIKLFQIHHASLGSYQEICEAHVFLGMVLREKSLLEEAALEFEKALVVALDYSPNPASVPPAAIHMFHKVLRRLLASPRGSISIKTEPRGARLTCDGKVAGSTPASMKDLLPGTHYLRVKREGYLTWAGAVQIKGNHLAAHEVFLQPTTRLVLHKSDLQPTKTILAEAARATRARLVLLVRLDPSAAPGKWKLSVYNPRDNSLGAEMLLASFGKPQPVSRPAIKPPVEPEHKEPFLPSPVATRQQLDDDDGSVFSSWWFWTLVGAAVVSAAVTIPLVMNQGGDLHVTLIRE